MSTQVQPSISTSSIGPNDQAFFLNNVLLKPQWEEYAFDTFQSNEQAVLMRTLSAFRQKAESVTGNPTVNWSEYGVLMTGIKISATVSTVGTVTVVTVDSSQYVNATNYMGQVNQQVMYNGIQGVITAKSGGNLTITAVGSTALAVPNGGTLGVIGQIRTTAALPSASQEWQPNVYSQKFQRLGTQQSYVGQVMGMVQWQDYTPGTWNLADALPGFNEYALSAAGQAAGWTSQLVGMMKNVNQPALINAMRWMSATKIGVETHSFFTEEISNTALTNAGFDQGFKGILPSVRDDGAQDPFSLVGMTMSQWQAVQNSMQNALGVCDSFLMVNGQGMNQAFQTFNQTQTLNVAQIQTRFEMFATPQTEYVNAMFKNSGNDTQKMATNFGWQALNVNGMKIATLPAAFMPFYHPGVGGSAKIYNNSSLMIPTTYHNVEIGGANTAIPFISFIWKSIGGGGGETFSGDNNGSLYNVRKMVFTVVGSSFAGGRGFLSTTTADQVEYSVSSEYSCRVVGLPFFRWGTLA